MSVVAPGSAQVVAGNRQLGKAALRIWAGIIAVVALIGWLVPLDTLASLAVRPWLLSTFKVIAFVVAIGWIALVIDAWRLGHPPGLNQKHRLIFLGSTLALVALVATPFVVATRYASAAHDAVVAMFPSGQVAAASDGRLNILLLGADAGPGRDGVRPDSISLVSIDVRTGRPVLVSVPRNLEKARFPDGTPAAAQFPRGFAGDGERTEWMLNAAWTYAEANPGLFPGTDDPGPVAMKQAVEGSLGIPVHYYAVIDLRGFQDLVDAVGGVTLSVDQPIPMGQGGQVIEPGERKLNGLETLWYARSRTGTSDYDRMSRQRCVLGAMLNELDPGTVLQNFTALADASASVVTTDIPQQQLPDLVEMAWKAKELPVTSLQLVPPLIVPADPDYGVIRAEVKEAFDASIDSGAAATDTGVADDAGAPDDAGGESAAPDDVAGTAGTGEEQEPPVPAMELDAACATA